MKTDQTLGAVAVVGVAAMVLGGLLCIHNASKQGESAGRELGVCAATCGSPYAEPLRLEHYAGDAAGLCVCPPEAPRNGGQRWSLARTDGGAP